MTSRSLRAGRISLPFARAGLEIRSPPLGDFTVTARAEEDTTRVGAVDVVIVAVKAYDNATALPLIVPMVGPETTILTLQNGVDSAASWRRALVKHRCSAA